MTTAHAKLVHRKVTVAYSAFSTSILNLLKYQKNSILTKSVTKASYHILMRKNKQKCISTTKLKSNCRKHEVIN